MSDLLPPWAGGAWERLERLRQLPSPRHVAGGLVVNRQGQLLMVYSSYAEQGWHFPKGGIDEGETPVLGAVKEIEEEAGVAVEAASYGTFDLGPGGTFTQSLGFGSPRVQAGEVYNPVCVYFGREVRVTVGAHYGEAMSVAALELLRRACREAGVSEGEFFDRRYALFDAWRERPVCWRQDTAYHVVPFAGYTPERLSGESQRVAWWSVEELERGAVGELHRHVGRVIEMPGLREAVASARERAAPG